jgi:hypothetical protein
MGREGDECILWLSFAQKNCVYVYEETKYLKHIYIHDIGYADDVYLGMDVHMYRGVSTYVCR